MFDIFYFKNCPTTVPFATQVSSVEQAQELCRTRYFWITDYLCDYSEWDFLWEPAPWESHFRHAFASQHQKDSGTYLIPKTGYSETKYNKITVSRLEDKIHWNNTDFDFDYSWHPDPTDPPYIYQFGTQWQKTGGPRYVVPGAREIKYVNSPRVIKNSIDSCWEIPDAEFADFDYTWHPDSTEQPYIYQFATQHQKTGGPKYVVPGATEIKYVDEVRIKTHRVATGIVVVKHTNNMPEMNTDIPIIETSRFISNYLGTLTRVLSKIQDHEYVWVVCDLCDYTNFDFSWHPEIWQNTMLHVFPSNEQKFGDTFFVHIPSFLERAREIEVLEWFNPLNFVQEKPVVREHPPAVKYTSDSVVDAVWNHTFTEPVVQFYRYQIEQPITISLWQERLRTVVPLRKGSESVLIPRDAKNHIKEQIYDYQWIDKKHKPADSTPCDVIFISNGESMAEKNWENLKSICPRAKRSDGVTGRELAYKTAAELSDTDWFYAVFAKTEVLPDFAFDLQPDRLQQPKHYILHSRNPLNGLEYGAMNINLYNKQLVLDTKPGLDFTLSVLHETIPVVASISRFNTDPWVTWRSAFREVLKLKLEVDEGAGPVIQHRLDVWCTCAEGENAEHCLQGAQDALEYYNSVNADYEKLKLSFDWAWLQDYYYSKYATKPWLESI